MDLLCYLGNSYFKMVFYPDSKATFKKRKLLLDRPAVVAVPVGTPVVARIKMRVNKEISVMYIKEMMGDSDNGSLQDALNNLNNFGDEEWVLGM